jgi:hypothetical protein
MTSIVRTTVSCCVAAAAVAAALPVAPSYAGENSAYVSSTGSGSQCTPTQPCLTVGTALSVISPPLRVVCLNSAGPDASSQGLFFSNIAVDIDCPQGAMGQLSFPGSNVTVRIRHFGFKYDSNPTHISFTGSGTLILEDCYFEDAPDAALDLEPNGALNVVIKNSRISNNGGGILLKPIGGSIKATLDHVTITGNSGGAIRSDSTDGVVNLDVSYSELSNNGGNGINAIAGTNQNIVSIKNTVIARNGTAGVQANGVNAGVLVSATLLDQNVAGATITVAGGNLFTYGNNDIVGPIGSGFTGTATPH